MCEIISVKRCNGSTYIFENVEDAFNFVESDKDIGLEKICYIKLGSDSWHLLADSYYLSSPNALFNTKVDIWRIYGGSYITTLNILRKGYRK